MQGTRVEHLLTELGTHMPWGDEAYVPQLRANSKNKWIILFFKVISQIHDQTPNNNITYSVQDVTNTDQLSITVHYSSNRKPY